ncbi:DDE-type integrase/transposase/recombinase [Microvirga sp. BSC39]|uniref:DDE-type integrase/transposase/recombinase n=1 Tax=Microvirga sp. BSC39 TaxID=1549810 RepID=UPI0004E92626|nr:DDE-type integrase/transposase/recombinase [Microvirga sp. BSC39]KFG69458.1 hypothetical protein JH26_11785 [Microvirga sp. BSC39]
MNRNGELWRFAKLRLVKLWNSIVEQDHRRIKRLAHPALGSKSFVTATQTIAGYEAMAMICKGQVVGVLSNDMDAQGGFIATRFGTAA